MATGRAAALLALPAFRLTETTTTSSPVTYRGAPTAVPPRLDSYRPSIFILPFLLVRVGLFLLPTRGIDTPPGGLHLRRARQNGLEGGAWVAGPPEPAGRPAAALFLSMAAPAHTSRASPTADPAHPVGFAGPRCSSFSLSLERTDPVPLLRPGPVQISGACTLAGGAVQMQCSACPADLPFGASSGGLTLCVVLKVQ